LKQQADQSPSAAVELQRLPDTVSGVAALAHRGTIGFPPRPSSGSRSLPETSPVPLPVRIAFAPTSSSRDVAEALERREAIHEGRRLIAPLAAPPAPQTAVDNEDLIREALAHRGTPYVWGGASRGGFDCSGFVLYVFQRTRGINLPHHAHEQAQGGKPVARTDLRPGDLVFFRTGAGIGHVGIYVGENKFVHAPHRGSSIRVEALAGWYDRQYAGARRYSPAPTAPPETALPPMAADSTAPPGALMLTRPAPKRN